MLSTAVRRTLLTLTCLLVGVALPTSLLVPSASADEPAPAAAAVVEQPFTPKQGVYFNNPMGTWDEQYAISDQLDRTVDATPPGATIYLTAYSMTAQQNVDALIRAYQRGVFVRLLIDSHVVSEQMVRIRGFLGTDTSKNSYFRTCTYSCMSNKPSFLHSKVATFSTSGGVNFVTMISSANPANTGVVNAWNNMYTVVGNQALYAANVKYFHDMLGDKSQPNYFRMVTSGNLKQYFTPRSSGDTMLSVLKKVTCTGADEGYGTKGRTRIRVAMYAWTNLRSTIARRLSKLKSQGCDVQVIYTADQVQERVIKALLTKTKKGPIAIYNGRRDRDGDGIMETYIHHKYLTINGVYEGKTNSKVVFTGSTNFTLNTIRSNNEVVLKIDDAATLKKFEANFKLIRDNWTKRVKTYTAAKKLTRKLQGELVVTEDGDVVRVGSREHYAAMMRG